MKTQNETCPVCAEGVWELHNDGIHSFTHKNKSHQVTGMLYAQCNHCGSKGFLKGQVVANKQRISAFENALNDYISPSNILRIRERYDISQKEAAKIFNCGPTQFSKWERGIVSPTGATSILLKKALAHPSWMEELARDAGVVIQLPRQQNTHVNQQETSNYVSNAWSRDDVKKVMEKTYVGALRRTRGHLVLHFYTQHNLISNELIVSNPEHQNDSSSDDFLSSLINESYSACDESSDQYNWACR